MISYPIQILTAIVELKIKFLFVWLIIILKQHCFTFCTLKCCFNNFPFFFNRNHMNSKDSNSKCVENYIQSIVTLWIVTRFTMGQMLTLQSWWDTAETLCLRPVYTGAAVSICTSRWGPMSRSLDEGSKPSMSPVGAQWFVISNQKSTLYVLFLKYVIIEMDF